MNLFAKCKGIGRILPTSSQLVLPPYILLRKTIVNYFLQHFFSSPELHFQSFSEVEVGVQPLPPSDIAVSIWNKFVWERLGSSVANHLQLLVSSPNRRRT